VLTHAPPEFLAAVTPHSAEGLFPASVHLSGRIGKAPGHIGLGRSYHHMMTALIVGEPPCRSQEKRAPSVSTMSPSRSAISRRRWRSTVACSTSNCAATARPRPGRFLDFRDPWGNRIEIVGYDNIQFTKAPNVLRGMGLTHLSKNKSAIKELKDKGMAPN